MVEALDKKIEEIEFSILEDEQEISRIQESIATHKVQVKKLKKLRDQAKEVLGDE